MKQLMIIIVLVAAGLYHLDVIGPGFVVPETLASPRTANTIETYEFTDLFDQNTPTSRLARKGYYTVVEGYIDSCTICKKLEADFKPFLQKRPDVLIRRLHFPENGAGQSFNGSSQQDINRQVANYYERLGKYRFNHVTKTANAYGLTTCGTPHIEIYGPDKQLIAADNCTEKNSKTGLAFIRKWIKAERP
jgi:hypothetical protein